MEKEIRTQLANAAQAGGLELTRPSKLRVLASRVDSGFFILLALPWLMLSTKVPWIFSGVGEGLVDPEFHFTFFLDLSSHFRIFPPTYFGSRLSWTLPGYAAFKLFSPLAAAYVLHLSPYYAATFSNYLILKQTVGQRAALVSTIFMGSYCYFLWAMGWNYVDGAGIAYFLLTILALTAAVHPGWRLWLALGGATYGAMIYSNLFLVVFTYAQESRR